MASVNEHVLIILVVVCSQCLMNSALEWEIVFEAFSYGLPNAHALFTGNETSADRSSLGDKQHFKHTIVNEWNKINISRVKIQIINNGEEAAYVTFNGHQSDRKSWMSIENILESSYSDVTYSSLKQHVGRTGFHFSVDGLLIENLGGYRRFYMNKLFHGCSGDVGWMLLIEGNVPCSYEKDTKTSYDYLLVGYVDSTKSLTLIDNIHFADSMRILLEYEKLEATGTTAEMTTTTKLTTTPAAETTKTTTATTTTKATTTRTTAGTTTTTKLTTTPAAETTKTTTATTTTKATTTRTTAGTMTTTKLTTTPAAETTKTTTATTTTKATTTRTTAGTMTTTKLTTTPAAETTKTTTATTTTKATTTRTTAGTMTTTKLTTTPAADTTKTTTATTSAKATTTTTKLTPTTTAETTTTTKSTTITAAETTTTKGKQTTTTAAKTPTTITAAETTTTTKATTKAEMTTTETTTITSKPNSPLSSKTTQALLEKKTFVEGESCMLCNPCEVIHTNLSISELRDMIRQLQGKLKVDKTKLSKTIGGLNSAQDPRFSSMAMGVVFGGTIFGSVFAALILPDVFNLIVFVNRFVQKLHQK